MSTNDIPREHENPTNGSLEETATAIMQTNSQLSLKEGSRPSKEALIAALTSGMSAEEITGRTAAELEIAHREYRTVQKNKSDAQSSLRALLRSTSSLKEVEIQNVDVPVLIRSEKAIRRMMMKKFQEQYPPESRVRVQVNKTHLGKKNEDVFQRGKVYEHQKGISENNRRWVEGIIVEHTQSQTKVKIISAKDAKGNDKIVTLPSPSLLRSFDEGPNVEERAINNEMLELLTSEIRDLLRREHIIE